jgi:hypothetical protein
MAGFAGRGEARRENVDVDVTRALSFNHDERMLISLQGNKAPFPFPSFLTET